ncbi:MAG: biopolymer transport protein ExbD [Bacteroidia bacterium]|jgi:biopolymer transport protein ExbD
MKRSHDTPQNALADIALLLLIFFLITTQFPKEDGIATTLPPLHIQQTSKTYTEIEIWLNAQDEIMLNAQYVRLSDLSQHLSSMIIPHNSDLRINLKSHFQSSYMAYVSVYDEIKQAYGLLHDSEAHKLFGKPFLQLSIQEKNIIKASCPVEIFEWDLVQ